MYVLHYNIPTWGRRDHDACNHRGPCSGVAPCSPALGGDQIRVDATFEFQDDGSVACGFSRFLDLESSAATGD